MSSGEMGQKRKQENNEKPKIDSNHEKANSTPLVIAECKIERNRCHSHYHTDKEVRE
jgi:hypothetical protein